jgi:hypothetical protein
MAEIKTKPTAVKVADFINAFADTEQKKKDAFELLKIMQEHTGFEPQMWGPSIIGFGTYHYKSDRSKQEGDWPLVGFSPRKAAISLYVFSGAPGQDEMLKNLGKFKMGKGCIYVKKLSDINVEVVKQLMDSTIHFLRKKFP